MARAFQRKGETYVAKLDGAERQVVAGLMEQVLELVAPDLPAPSPSSDPFDDIVAGLGSLGAGVSLAPEDQVGSTNAAQHPGADASVPDDAAFVLGADASVPDPAAFARDPALDRLLPTANREDDGAAAEFRRLSEHSIRTVKARNLRGSIEALAHPPGRGGRLELTRQQAQSFLVALTDVRLVLAERMGVRTEEEMEELEAYVNDPATDADDPAVYAMLVYDFTTWLQETLATALLPGAGREV